MKRATLIAVLALAVLGLTGIFATNGYAYPGSTVVPCVQACHHTTKPVGDPSLNPTSTPTPTPTMTVMPMSTPDATCAVTVSNAVPSYRGDAVLHLSATDNVGGWGVGYLYYTLDDSPTRLIRVPVDWTNSMGSMNCEASITVPAPATGSVAHTISFWSQDNYGNVESATTKAFTVSALTKMPMSIAVNHTWVYRYHPVTISGTVAKAGIRVVLYQKKPYTTTYTVLKTITTSSAKTWSYTYKPSKHGTYYFKARFAGDAEWLPSNSTYKGVYVR